MGRASRIDRCAVVSTARLTEDDGAHSSALVHRLAALLLHELGHLLRLQHCGFVCARCRRACAMAFSADARALDHVQAELCQRCRHVLREHLELM